MTNLIGRRAVYTQIENKWNGKESVEISRKVFHGEIVGLMTQGTSHCAGVVILYDEGGLRWHDLDNITVEGDTRERL